MRAASSQWTEGSFHHVHLPVTLQNFMLLEDPLTWTKIRRAGWTSPWLHATTTPVFHHKQRLEQMSLPSKLGYQANKRPERLL